MCVFVYLRPLIVRTGADFSDTHTEAGDAAIGVVRQVVRVGLTAVTARALRVLLIIQNTMQYGFNLQNFALIQP